MTLSDPSMAFLAASGGDTVKLFDVSLEPGDPCTLSYTPSPGSMVNSVKWNHTNLVVASAGEDKTISLRRRNGQSMGTIPIVGIDRGDNIEENILAISFGNKWSRYLCSGGTGQVVRIWDLQRKQCIKWLRGHTTTITSAVYNCKDEHLASISLSGDLIIHNLASGARAAELKDPHEQVLRVLDYSRISRHLLVTAGDDGTAHLWDTTSRSPKISWLKQHSAPMAGISFSPTNDKIIASVGLDKKLYTYDSGSKRPSFWISYEAPFSSLAFRDDGLVLAAGTSNGRVVFYDIRETSQPLTVLRAFGGSEAVTSLCWQRSKPVLVNESTCTADMALLGGSTEDSNSIIMPDQLPSMTSSNVSQSTTSLIFPQSTPTSSGAGEKTPIPGHLWPGGTLARLHAPRSRFNYKDDMDVFSPVVDVHPITPSLELWDDPAKRQSSLLFRSASKRFPTDAATNEHPIFDWKPNAAFKEDDTRSFTGLGSPASPSSKSENSAITPPEAWGGEKLSGKNNHLYVPSRLGPLTSGTFFAGFQDLSTSSLGSPVKTETFRTKDISTTLDTSTGLPEHLSTSSLSMSPETKGIMGLGTLDSSRVASLNLPRKFSTYAERISTSLSGSTSPMVGSPKIKKTGAETKEERLNSILPRIDTAVTTTEPGIPPAMNGGISETPRASKSDPHQGSNFTLQLFQGTLEETLDSFQKSIHGDLRNLHIEILRQFHMQEVETSSALSSILENQVELMNEIKSLRKENQQLRQML